MGRVGRSIFFWCVMVLLAAGLGWIYLAGEAIPQAVEFHYTDAEQAPLTAGELSHAQEYSSHPFTCADSQVETVRTPSGESGTVIAVYTDPMYPGIYPFTWTMGHFWAEGNGAVISQRTAEELFRTRDAVGALLQVGGKQYTVTGVYRSAPLGRAFGPERIFLPITPERPVTMLAFSGDRSAGYYTASLPRETGGRLVSYTPVLLRREWNVVPMILRLLILVLAAGALLRLCRRTFPQMETLAERWRTDMRDCYLKEVLQRNRRRILSVLTGMCGILLSAGVIWWAVSQPPPLPVDYVQENLFALSGWLELFRQRRALLHTIQNPAGGYCLYLTCESIRDTAYLSGIMLLMAGLRPRGGNEERKELPHEKRTSGGQMQ